MVKYSSKPANDTKTAMCRVDDLRCHYKNIYNVARACRGMNVVKAIAYMENVLEHKAIVPFRRYTGGPGRKAMCKQFNHHNGRFPEKSCKNVINLLKKLKSSSSALSSLAPSSARIRPLSASPRSRLPSRDSPSAPSEYAFCLQTW